MSTHDVIILGGGAAGLMCAIEAGRRGRRVVVLEANDRVGRKILISGGGRCNFTNLYAGPDNYFSDNPDFCRSALARYTPGHFIDLVEQHGIPYHEKKLGQLFCDGSAKAIVDLLLAECAESGVEIRTDCEVWSVDKPSSFVVDTSLGEFAGEALVVATGGLSIPKMGASPLGYTIAEQFDVARVEVRPGLVPLTFDGDDRAFFEGMSGLSIDAAVSCNGQSFRENILCTHRGLSGPAVLQVSSAWHEGDTIRIDLLPNESALEFLINARDDVRELAGVLADRLPRRFAHAWCYSNARSMPMQRYSERDREDIAKQVQAWELRPAGSEGYGKAEVTVGGIDTRELDQRSMQSRRVSGLFFIGEVVDVTGWLGGYNFQWAWASGWAAGQAV